MGLILVIFALLLMNLGMAIQTPFEPSFEDYLSLGRTLGLNDENIEEIWATFSSSINHAADLSNASKKNGIIPAIACLTAKAVLDASEIETPPSTETIERNWSQACHLTPYCVIKPKTTEHVSIILQIISLLGVKFAIRGGGHSPNPGWAGIDQNGILIDMQYLSSVHLSSDKKTASVGPGARWGDVYAALDEHEALVIGGRLGDVGVGGLILGGGYFHISSEYGLASDNVKNFQVVLSDGKIVNANADEHNDLYWALRGGGSNFGIVTRFDLFTIPVHKVWLQVSVHPTIQTPALIEAFDKWQRDFSSDSKSSVSLIIGLDSATLGLIYAEPLAKPPKVFEIFNDIVPLATVIPATTMTFHQLTQALTQPKTTQRHEYRALSTRIDTDLTQKMYQYWQGKANHVRDLTGANQTFVIQSVSQHLIDQTRKFGGSPLNIPDGPQQWWTTLVDWDKEEDDEVVRSVSIETTTEWNRLARERGSSVGYLFLNDASRDQNPLGSYGARSLAKLKEISLKYDKRQVFQTLQNGSFRLSKA